MLIEPTDKSHYKWVVETGWFLAEGFAGLASTFVPFEQDYWVDRRAARQVERRFRGIVTRSGI